MTNQRWELVKGMLRQDCNPEQISGRLKKELQTVDTKAITDGFPLTALLLWMHRQ